MTVFGRTITVSARTRHIIAIKVVVASGLTAVHYLPPEYALKVSWLTNIAWLIML